MAKTLKVPGFELQQSPRIYVTALPGRWLLDHATPSWRIRKPKKGFQRIVREERAQAIAIAVLDQHRTFPNAIVLATDRDSFPSNDGTLEISGRSRFLVVDGQHRLYAQEYSSFEARYGCIVHTGLNEVEMARLFIEINDNQKRVPSSLRWDLVRLVKPENDQFAVEASELVFALTTDTASPLHQRIDLTGELPKVSLKQGSLAPELRSFVSTRVANLRELDFDAHYDILVRYFAAIKSLDPDGWRTEESPFYKNRVLRVLIRLLPLILRDIHKPPKQVTASTYREYLGRIDSQSLSPDAIRAAQGSAGMREIFDELKRQVFS